MAVGKLRVLYRLSPEGKRKMLLEGKEAQAVQEIVFEMEMTDELLKKSKIDSAGVATINLSDPVSVGGFFSIKHPPLDEPIFKPEQAMEQMRLFQLEIEKTFVKVREREEDMRLSREERSRRYHADVVAYARRKASVLEKKYGTLLWLSIKEFDGDDKESFDKLVKEFVSDCERKEAERRREKAEAEKRIWIQDHGSERLKAEYDSGVPCQARYVRERVLTEIGIGWYIDPGNTFPFEPARLYSVVATQVVETLRMAGLNPKIVWLPDGITRGEPPDNADEENPRALEPDEFNTYDDPGYLPALGGCEAIMVEGYLGRYNIYYPVGPKALKEGMGRIEKEAKWLKTNVGEG